MTKDQLREVLHREMLLYYFAQREPMLEMKAGESFVCAVKRKMQAYADCGFPREITEADIDMLCNCSFAGLFRYDIEQGAEKIARLRAALSLAECVAVVSQEEGQRNNGK